MNASTPVNPPERSHNRAASPASTACDWPHVWLDWPDFSLPRDTADAVTRIRDLHRRAGAGEAVEVACGGGIGRTGTVVAALAILAGTPTSPARQDRPRNANQAHRKRTPRPPAPTSSLTRTTDNPDTQATSSTARTP